MRKYIIPLFLSLCPTIAPAIIISDCEFKYTQDCHTTVEHIGCHIPGCGGSSKDDCKRCPAGEYSANATLRSSFSFTTCSPTDALTTDIKCQNCTLNGSHSLNTGLKWTTPVTHNIYLNGATSNNECVIKIECQPGQYYDSGTFACKSCPDNTYKSTSFTETKTVRELTNTSISDSCTPCCNNATNNDDHTNCDCNYGYHIGTDINNTKNVGSENCIPIIFAVKYNDGSNTLDDKEVPSQYRTIGLTQLFSLTLPTVDCNQPSINGILQFLCMSKTGYNFDNQWTADKKLNVCNPGQCLGEKEAGYAIAVDATATLTDDDMGDVTFTAVWKAKEFTVNYNTDGRCTQTSHPCTYDSSTCKLDFKCDQQNPGEYITGWKCTDGCSDQETTYKSNANISNISGGNDMTLTAKWEECDAGYYCDGGTQNPCPAGCTSDTGSIKIADCYLSHETQFCDQDKNCFKIDGLKIHHKEN